MDDAGSAPPGLSGLEHSAPSSGRELEWGRTRFFRKANRQAMFGVGSASGEDHLCIFEGLGLDVFAVELRAQIQECSVEAMELATPLRSQVFLRRELRSSVGLFFEGGRWRNGPSEFREFSPAASVDDPVQLGVEIVGEEEKRGFFAVLLSHEE